MLKFMISGFLIGALAFSGCKPSDNASVKTIDNFAKGKDIHKNSCSGAPEVKKSRISAINDLKISVDINGRKTDPTLVGEVKESLTALPSEFIALFSAMSVGIMITDKTNETCAHALPMDSEKRKLFLNGEASFSSCQVRSNDTARKNGVGVIIFVSPTIGDIRHSLIRSMAYALVDSASYLKSDSNGKLSFGEIPNKGLEEFRGLLAKAFLADITSNEKMNSVRAYMEDAYLGSGAFQTIVNNVDKSTADSSKIWDGVEFKTSSELREAYRAAFEKTLFADAFDSFYCNTHAKYDSKLAEKAFYETEALNQNDRDAALKNTKLVFRDLFPQTFKIFEKMEPSLLAGADEIAGLNAPKASGKAEFGLAGATSSRSTSTSGSSGFFSRVGSTMSSMGSAIYNGASRVASNVSSGISQVSSAVRPYASTALSYGRSAATTVASGAQYAGQQAYRGSQAVVSGVQYAGRQAYSGAQYVGRQASRLGNAVLDSQALYNVGGFMDSVLRTPGAVGDVSLGAEKGGGKVGWSFNPARIYEGASNWLYSGGNPWRYANNSRELGTASSLLWDAGRQDKAANLQSLQDSVRRGQGLGGAVLR